LADAPRILIVTSRYYAHIMTELEAGVSKASTRSARPRISRSARRVRNPRAIAMAAQTGEWDGFVALGCVIRGETSTMT
jgi:6,7-dimethyl-8-ribityllumazine synthase